MQNTRSNMTTGIALRFLAYTLFIVASINSLPFFFEHYGIAFFKDGGLLEWAQFALLVATSAVFIGGACFFMKFRHLLLVLASLTVFAAFRELDGLFDDVPWLSWKIGSVVPLFAAVVAVRNWQQLNEQISRFVPMRGFGMLWGGFVIVGIVQGIGHGDFLQAVMGVDADYVRDYRRIVEESGEFPGYFVIFVGSIELLIQIRALSTLSASQVTRPLTTGEEPEPA